MTGGLQIGVLVSLPARPPRTEIEGRVAQIALSRLKQGPPHTVRSDQDAMAGARSGSAVLWRERRVTAQPATLPPDR
jgi:hypothetical protein